MANDNTVAVLGTGLMGAAMARNLASAGMEVRAWNRSREKAEPLADDSIKVADSPAEAAEGADFLLTMLADADVISGVVEGDGESPLSNLAENGIWLQMSTIGLEGNDRLAKIAANSGVTYVDAPVLGTKQPAEQGQLIMLASGPEDVQERCATPFDAMGARTVWLGGAGAGSRMKLVANSWIVGLLGALGETIALSQALDIDPAQFLDIIDGGPLNLPYAQMKGQMMINEDFPTSFAARLARKDAGLVLDAASSEGLHLALAEAVADRFDKAIEAGYGEDDMAAIYEGVKAARE